MIMFDNFTIECDDCGSQCSVGVEEAMDGEAVIIVTCDNCKIIERMQTEIQPFNDEEYTNYNEEE